MSPTCSPERFDELRAAHSDLGFALYALEPHGSVTLEILTPDGETYSFLGLTAEAAMARAFPPTSVPVDWPEPGLRWTDIPETGPVPAEAPSIFD